MYIFIIIPSRGFMVHYIVIINIIQSWKCMTFMVALGIFMS